MDLDSDIMTELATLPIELWEYIISYCEADSLLHLLDSCKSLYKYKHRVDIWLRFYLRGGVDSPHMNDDIHLVYDLGYRVHLPNKFEINYDQHGYKICSSIGSIILIRSKFISDDKKREDYIIYKDGVRNVYHMEMNDLIITHPHGEFDYYIQIR